MAKRLRNDAFERINKQMDFEQAIVQAYVSGKFLTKQIADTYGITPRSVQRIVTKWGSVRTQADGNRVAAPLSAKHRVRELVQRRRPGEGKSKDNQLVQMRHVIICLMRDQGRDFNHCELCGAFIPDNKFDLHHTKYDGATYQDLRIVCRHCNLLPENRYLD